MQLPPKVTDRAFARLAEIGAATQGQALRIAVEGGGCSGYKIKLSPTTDIPQDAQMLSETIFSDAISLELLNDAVMDWIDDPFRPTFHFTPPTGASSCGCGSSFTI